MTTVVAAIIRKDSKVLACQRRPDQPHPGEWEFPGGKVEDGETPHQALYRELREELGVETKIGAEIERYNYSYPGRDPILLVFFEAVAPAGAEFDFSHFADARWVELAELPGLDFLEGDIDFVKRLSGS